MTFLNHTSVDVAVLRRVQVVGAVQKPGLYHVDPTMTIADAIALAGGVSPDGRTDRVEIIREGQRLRAGTGRMLISQSAVQSGDQLFVPERSWVSRNMAHHSGRHFGHYCARLRPYPLSHTMSAADPARR